MSIKVLIVDDDDVVVFLHKKVVVKSGLSSLPISFGNGSAAFDFLNGHWKEGESFLILLDINMPVMNGWEFLETIQTSPFSDLVSVIMVTSSVNYLDREKAKQFCQVIGFIEKPINLQSCEQIKSFPKISNLF